MRRGATRVSSCVAALLPPLLGGCDAFGWQRQSAALRWDRAETVYFHQGIEPGPVLTTDAAGALKEERRHDPFGQPVDATMGGMVVPVDYRREPQNSLGKLTDPNTGWSDHGARWMAPSTARWLSPDPEVKGPSAQKMSAPWTLNPYQYVDQKPTTQWDPDGKCAAPIGLKQGEVGVCFEAFIASKYVGIPFVGRGDDRTFAGNDPDATARFQLRLRIVPTGKFPIVDQQLFSNRSGIFAKDLGPHGDVFVNKETSKTPKGDLDIKYDVSALNGVRNSLGYQFRFLVPHDINEPIDLTLKLRVTLAGKVSITGGEHDGYPSYGVYVYRQTAKGLETKELYRFQETTPDRLQDPMDVRIDSTPPK
jgi:RHS repeat-associated protein